MQTQCAFCFACVEKKKDRKTPKNCRRKTTNLFKQFLRIPSLCVRFLFSTCTLLQWRLSAATRAGNKTSCIEIAHVHRHNHRGKGNARHGVSIETVRCRQPSSSPVQMIIIGIVLLPFFTKNKKHPHGLAEDHISLSPRTRGHMFTNSSLRRLANAVYSFSSSLLALTCGIAWELTKLAHSNKFGSQVSIVDRR